MGKNLVIVESPAKAKTIEKFLGADYQVVSSYGHIRDLTKGDKAVDIENNFEPIYEVSDDKKDVVKNLIKLANKSDMVWLASDEDREGEAISWHLKEALELPEPKLKRIVFNEITKTAILKAIDNPRNIDYHLVDAQQARRILDRLVGFELSPVLWRKVKPSLSAGRVQSVSVRLIVEREREVVNFEFNSAYKVVAEFLVEGKTKLKAELTKRHKTLEDAESFVKKCIGASYTIEDLQKKDSKKNPSAPFTTSTLQQEASRKLRFSVSKTMIVAQRLYESGYITYMRTDSVNLSELALEGIQKEIVSRYGEKYAQQRKYKTKSAGAQEAHEAVRPTDFSVTEIEGERDAMALYDLIWKRTIASQMSEAEIEKTQATIAISTVEDKLIAEGEVLKFDGFLKVYLESNDDDEDGEDENKKMLPPLNIGQELKLVELAATQRFTRPPARYTEAALVKKLEELGIGRPSTYAPTISTIQKRGYVEKAAKDGTERKYKTVVLKNDKVTVLERTEVFGEEKSKLFPTDIGSIVNDFLVANFPKVLDYQFTADVEREFDDIAQGKLEWRDMMAKFYAPFHATVTDTLKNSEKASGERKLGLDDKGLEITVRMAKFGAVIQRTNPADADAKPEYAKVPPGKSIENITLEEALEGFKLPRFIGDYKDEKMVGGLGRFGPYIKYGNLFVSIPKEMNVLEITSDEAIVLVQEKIEKEANKYIKKFDQEGRDDVAVLNGRWGPYIAIGKNNVKIPKGTDPASLTLVEILDLAEKSEKAPSKRTTRKTTKK